MQTEFFEMVDRRRSNTGESRAIALANVLYYIDDGELIRDVLWHRRHVTGGRPTVGELAAKRIERRFPDVLENLPDEFYDAIVDVLREQTGNADT